MLNISSHTLYCVPEHATGSYWRFPRGLANVSSAVPPTGRVLAIGLVLFFYRAKALKKAGQDDVWSRTNNQHSLRYLKVNLQ